MAYDHAYIRTWEETWEQLGGQRDAYDIQARVWGPVETTTWELTGKNFWGDVAPSTEIEFEDDSFMAQVLVRSPLIYPTELDIEIELSVVAGERDWEKMLLRHLPWYLRESEVVKNCCKMGGAILSTCESYLLIADDSRMLATAINTLPTWEAKMGIKAENESGALSLSERRDNLRRIWRMMNENVSWAPREIYYLPFIGKYSASNAIVEGTKITDPENYDDPVVQAKIAQWANPNGLEVVSGEDN